MDSEIMEKSVSAEHAPRPWAGLGWGGCVKTHLGCRVLVPFGFDLDLGTDLSFVVKVGLWSSQGKSWGGDLRWCFKEGKDSKGQRSGVLTFHRTELLTETEEDLWRVRSENLFRELSTRYQSIPCVLGIPEVLVPC